MNPAISMFNGITKSSVGLALLPVMWVMAVSAQETVVPQKAQEDLAKIYRDASESMKLCSRYYANKTGNTVAKLKTYVVPWFDCPRIYSVGGGMFTLN
jgi:hypothetical protein